MNNKDDKIKKIVLTGGGTAGHVTPNIALLPVLKEHGFEISYIGSYEGIEKELIEKENIKYYGISSGKLRRYIDVKNITDIGRVLKGIEDARRVLRKEKPNVIFSKGGFVTVPVAIASSMLRIPLIIHESDLTIGLANKIAMKFAKKICCTFPETLKHLPENVGVLTGTPIRQELFEGNKTKGEELCGFLENKPSILIMGGSQGSKIINDVIRNSLDELLAEFNIVHICGKGNVQPNINEDGKKQGYKQFEYVGEELKDLLAMSDMMISRAGANAISEFLALRKPQLLIPLSKNASRGDQILNANSFKKQNYSIVLQEEDLNKESLLSEINNLYNNKDYFIKSMQNSNLNNAIEQILTQIKNI